jgi:hypothetical protein
VDLGTSLPVTDLAVSPEGLYLVALSARQLSWVDLERASVVRRSTMSADTLSSVLGLVFSANGRWLILKMQRQGVMTHQLFDVGTGIMVWDKPSVTAVFDLERPAIHLTDGAGRTAAWDLPS